MVTLEKKEKEKINFIHKKKFNPNTNRQPSWLGEQQPQHHLISSVYHYADHFQHFLKSWSGWVCSLRGDVEWIIFYWMKSQSRIPLNAFILETFWDSIKSTMIGHLMINNSNRSMLNVVIIWDEKKEDCWKFSILLVSRNFDNGWATRDDYILYEIIHRRIHLIYLISSVLSFHSSNSLNAIEYVVITQFPVSIFSWLRYYCGLRFMVFGKKSPHLK